MKNNPKLSQYMQPLIVQAPKDVQFLDKQWQIQA
jgi:hypothetical protein